MSDEFIRCKDVEVIEIEGEFVILHVIDYKVTKLNSIGGYIWALLEQRMTREKIVARLRRQYDVSVPIASRDVALFLDELVRIGLVERCSPEQTRIS